MKRILCSKRLYLPLSIAFWIGLWWCVALALKKPLLLPTPLAVLSALLHMMSTADFYRVLLTSLLRITAGLLLALLSGACIAFLETKCPPVRALLSPLLSLCKATPVVSFIYLLLLFVGRDALPAIIAFTVALPSVVEHLREGLAATDPRLLEMARAFALSRRKRFFNLTLPSLRPYLRAACRATLALAFKAGIAAEVLCLPVHAIGRGLFEGNWYLETDLLFAWTLVTVLLGALIELCSMRLLEGAAAGGKEKRDD